MSTYADEKSDEGIRPMKQPNKEGMPSAEAVEERTSPEGNGAKMATLVAEKFAAAVMGEKHRIESIGSGSA
jgi:hypothetical protein